MGKHGALKTQKWQELPQRGADDIKPTVTGQLAETVGVGSESRDKYLLIFTPGGKYPVLKKNETLRKASQGSNPRKTGMLSSGNQIINTK